MNKKIVSKIALLSISSLVFTFSLIGEVKGVEIFVEYLFQGRDKGFSSNRELIEDAIKKCIPNAFLMKSYFRPSM
ncbi:MULTISPECIES: hypothetical protein [Thermodesulfobacterium]|uniref:Uncharacterized protein n=1 Tax=Thermodesulfobacterium commune DSM 2178 TaxID=289377 RepID=A0A075WZQ0_9BACT|nr:MULTISPECIES: hypothetical protein [Thermodesulfobacterium]AIH04152.1 hypothetical protein HL41_04910 [Thermodesulfobacterium commune DSM 2178]